MRFIKEGGLKEVFQNISLRQSYSSLSTKTSMYKLRPYFVEKIWGGNFIKRLSEQSEANQTSLNTFTLPIGESWELSTLREGNCFIGEKNICDFIIENGAEEFFWGKRRECSYVIKYIDAGEDLSIQVHPSDEFVKNREYDEFQNGKLECWIILGTSKPGAGIYLGLLPEITKEQFEERVRLHKSVEDLLHFIPVEVGDFFVVPPGAIHAIGAGVFLLEVQQRSGLTYRLWDWGRIDKTTGKPRELHIKDGLAAANFESDFNRKLLRLKQEYIWRPKSLSTVGVSVDIRSFLFFHQDFRLSLLTLNYDEAYILHLKEPEQNSDSYSDSLSKTYNDNYFKDKEFILDSFFSSFAEREVGHELRAVTIICLEGHLEVVRDDDHHTLKTKETLLATYEGGSILKIGAKERSKIVIID